MRFWDRVLMSLEGVGIAFDAIRANKVRAALTISFSRRTSTGTPSRRRSSGDVHATRRPCGSPKNTPGETTSPSSSAHRTICARRFSARGTRTQA